MQKRLYIVVASADTSTKFVSTLMMKTMDDVIYIYDFDYSHIIDIGFDESLETRIFRMSGYMMYLLWEIFTQDLHACEVVRL